MIVLVNVALLGCMLSFLRISWVLSWAENAELSAHGGEARAATRALRRVYRLAITCSLLAGFTALAHVVARDLLAYGPEATYVAGLLAVAFAALVAGLTVTRTLLLRWLRRS